MHATNVTLLALIIHAIDLAATQTPESNGIWVVSGTEDEGPRDVPKSEFEALINKPNATGTFPLSGPNISTPYFETNTIHGWSLSISVRADMPLKNSTLGSQYLDKVYTGGKITLNAPEALLNSSDSATKNLSVNNDWQVCLIHWGLDNQPYNNKLREDDGTCTSVLSTQCIKDMEGETIRRYQSSAHCFCPSITDVSSCADDSTEAWRTTCYATTFNSTLLRTWTNGQHEVHSYGAWNASDPGDIAAYNNIGSVAWPVIIVFAKQENVTGEGLVNNTAKMSCIRAKEATAGSNIPTGEDIGEGQKSTGNHIGNILVTLIGASVCSTLLLITL